MLAYARATATQDRSCICNLHCSSRQLQILNPLSKARNWTVTSWFQVGFVNHCTMMGTPWGCRFEPALAQWVTDSALPWAVYRSKTQLGCGIALAGPKAATQTPNPARSRGTSIPNCQFLSPKKKKKKKKKEFLWLHTITNPWHCQSCCAELAPCDFNLYG